MKRWPTKPLAEIATVVRGVSFDKSQVSDEPRKNSIPVLRAGNIQSSLLTDSDLVHVPEELVSEEQRMRSGDLAICMSSGSPAIVGKTAYLDSDWRGSIGAFCAIVRFNINFHHRFGSYWFRSPAFMQWRDSNAKGANIQNLRRTDLEKLEIPVPPLAEQERIVKLLDEADELRKLRAQADRRSADLIPALFHEMFGDPAYSWQNSTLGELVQDFRYGTSNKSANEGKPALRIPNVVGQAVNLDDLKFVPVSDSDFERLRLQDGDILFVRTNGNADYVGRCAVFDAYAINSAGYDAEEFIYASYLIRARLKAGSVLPLFVQHYLAGMEGRRALRARSKTSAGQFNINTEGLGTIPVPVPPLPLQQEFAQRVSEIRALQAAQAASRQRVEHLFQSMLHRAFNQEL